VDASRAKLNGLNILRLNGGTSIFETEQFYNLCDENGLIVWQEAPLNWVDSPGTSSIDVWKEQLTQSALRFRQHPSTGIYLAGNEYDPFVNGIEPLVGLIREVFAGYDGKRPFRMNSPCGGDVHAYSPDGIYAGTRTGITRSSTVGLILSRSGRSAVLPICLC